MSKEKGTEKPSPKKLREGRKEGRTPRTPDLGGSLGLLAGTVLLPLSMHAAATRSRALLVRVSQVVAHPDPMVATGLLHQVLVDVGLTVAPLALGMLCVGVAASLAQGGLHLATKAAKPKLSRANPLPGLKRLLGPHSLVDAAKSVLKAGVLGALAWNAVHRLAAALTLGGARDLQDTVGVTMSAILSLLRTAALVGLVFAAVDYAHKRRQSSSTLKMTKQEVKQENKQAEGDPQIKSAIRGRQLAMSRNRMMSDAATADVLLVNPTHVAVALRYRPGEGAPTVVAKGAGAVATRLRALAEDRRIPMVADVPLARAIYQQVDIGGPVPPELYEAVARVLAFVFSVRAKGRSLAGVNRLSGAA